jgi:hypothetical protein
MGFVKEKTLVRPKISVIIRMIKIKSAVPIKLAIHKIASSELIVS